MTQIILVLHHSENRRLLAQRLERFYSVLLPSPSEVQADWLAQTGSDLVILDRMALRHLQETLHTYRKAKHPVFFPILLINTRSERNALPSTFWNVIDDQISIPCSPEKLERRIKILLRTRTLSLSLKVTNEKLEVANELKSQLVSIVSHEFRNSLNSISGLTQILRLKIESTASEKIQVLLGRLSNAIQRSEQLTEELLILGRTGSNRLKFQPKSLNLERFCRRLIENVQIGSESASKVVLTMQGNGDSAVMDEVLLDHILTNLVSNALKYSTDDVSVEMTISTERQQVTFQIQDSGIGIPVEDQERLFESFYRANNVGKIAGTGLGLSIVQQCVNLHQGTISMQSEINVGTQFTVVLPLFS